MLSTVKAIEHSAPSLVGALAVGTALSSIKSRQLKGPSSIFIAVGVGSTIFRFINYIRGNQNSKLAAWIASIAFYRLCSHAHRQILLSYGLVEAFLQYYWKHRFLPQTMESFAALAATTRVGYAYLVHAEWLPMSTLRLFDYQSNLPITDLEYFRRNIHTCEVTRCVTMHPGQTCKKFAITGTLGLLKRSLQVFVPIHAASIVASIVNKKAIHWEKSLDSFFRSIAFLTTSYMSALFCSCIFPQRNHKWVALFASSMPYFALFIEPPKRRTSLLKAISCWGLITCVGQIKMLKAWKNVKQWPWSLLATILYAATMTKILERPQLQNDLAMKFLYGRSMRSSKPSHKAENFPQTMA